MDWENERYIRVYTRETVDDCMLSWEADALWGKIMKKLDRAGVLDMGSHGWKGVALLVRMPAEVVLRVHTELLNDGRIEERGRYLIAPNFMKAQEAKQSDKQRQAESRARRRDFARRAEIEEKVTKRDEESQNVTKEADSVTTGHTASQSVTPSLAVPSLAEPSLLSGAPEAAPRDTEQGSKPKAKRKRKAKPKDPPNPDHQTFVDAFHRLYMDANGGEPPSWRGKEMSLVKALLSEHGLDRCLTRARNMFLAPPPFPKPPYDLGTLYSQFDKFAHPYRAGATAPGGKTQAQKLYEESERVRLAEEGGDPAPDPDEGIAF